MPTTTSLHAAQQQTADRLIASSWFDDIAVLTEVQGDIESRIQIAVAQIGTCAVVMTPKAEVGHQNISGPFFESAKVVVRVMENVVVNQSTTGTQKYALETVSNVLACLHQFIPDIADGAMIAEPSAFELVAHPSCIVYDCQFRTSFKNQLDVNRTSTPVLSQAGSLVTMTCADAGARIYYTVDEENPPAAYSLNLLGFGGPKRGTEYTSPITVSAGQIIVARAWQAEYVASRSAEMTAT